MPLTLYPYLLDDTWVFDDERTRLKEEAYVRGATDMISALVEAKEIPNATRGFALTFAGEPFEGFDVKLTWQRSEVGGGDWYSGDVFGKTMECWLCPALLLYFATPPRELYVGGGPLPTGATVIWTPKPGETPQRVVGVGDDDTTRTLP